MKSKKKKKGQEQEVVNNKEKKFNQIIETLRAEIFRHLQAKKFVILTAARELKDAGHALHKICDRIIKGLEETKYWTSPGYVRQVLPDEYKDLEQSRIAKMRKNHELL